MSLVNFVREFCSKMNKVGTWKTIIPLFAYILTKIYISMYNVNINAINALIVSHNIKVKAKKKKKKLNERFISMQKHSIHFLIVNIILKHEYGYINLIFCDIIFLEIHIEKEENEKQKIPGVLSNTKIL